MRWAMTILDRLLGRKEDVPLNGGSTDIARKAIEDRREYVLRRLHNASSNIQATAEGAMQDARRGHHQ